MSNSTKLSYLQRTYQYYFQDGADPRVETWPLMDGPGNTILILVAYVYFATSLGPRLMKDRKPFDLKNVLIIYNAVQAVASFWLFTECIRAGWFWDYSFRCQPIDRSYNPRAMRTARGSWWFLITKFVDLLDTVFFVLRKRFEHITVLHVVHHALMPIAIWYGVKFIPGGHGTFCGLINTFIHFVMYTYYLVAALGPQYKKYLWWKKYLTIMQMVQFFVGTIHAGQLFFIDCDFPKFYAWFSMVIGPLFFSLFYDFYIKAYFKSSRHKKEMINGQLTNGITKVKESELVRRRALSMNGSSERGT